MRRETSVSQSGLGLILRAMFERA
ncbi:hypothetical protein JNB_10464 [Janibacter sp. HTCC2649]|nr:hypothetical protein JNB_10464 [Janibacter sp. HTCC2649]